MKVFKVLDDESIVKLKMGDSIPLFLVRFPYNYLRQNERFNRNSSKTNLLFSSAGFSI